jgi:hypothetical protein
VDPNLFHLDWDRVWEVVAAVAVLLERALSVVFEHVTRFGSCPC